MGVDVVKKGLFKKVSCEATGRGCALALPCLLWLVALSALGRSLCVFTLESSVEGQRVREEETVYRLKVLQQEEV